MTGLVAKSLAELCGGDCDDEEGVFHSAICANLPLTVCSLSVVLRSMMKVDDPGHPTAAHIHTKINFQ